MKVEMLGNRWVQVTMKESDLRTVLAALDSAAEAEAMTANARNGRKGAYSDCAPTLRKLTAEIEKGRLRYEKRR